MRGRIINGDALSELKKLPDASVDCSMSSPPYWALRDYGVEGQLGLEPTFEEFISDLCDIYDEVKRVLKPSGTCWVNLGDTYASSGASEDRFKGQSQSKGFSEGTLKAQGRGRIKNYPEKSLCLIPHRFAIEMINRGWILRNTIIWHKSNCMPQSAKDRFTVDFEYIFFFTKAKRYFFDPQKEPIVLSSVRDNRKGNGRFEYGGKWNPENAGPMASKSNMQSNFVSINPEGRNKRCVWKINPKPFPEAHFAVYPEELCETPIKAGCPPGGVVLDPFLGSGTTALVAEKLGRRWLGIELNPEYVKIAKKRLEPYRNQSRLTEVCEA